MDSKESETKKPEEINNAPTPEEQLERVVGGAAKGTHIANVTIELLRASGDKPLKYM
jgi:hypothetical protein